MSSRCSRLLLLVLPLLAVACGDDPEGGNPSPGTPPTVREVQPTGGPIAGNTLLNVYGSGFQDGAKVFLGDQELQRTVVVNAFRIYGYTPNATSAQVDVRVVNPGGAYGVLVKGFTFEGPPAPNIDQAEVLNGNREAVSGGQPVGVLVEGAITVAGLTRGVGQGGGVRAQVGFAPGDASAIDPASYTWEEATYDRDSDTGEADVYKGNVLLQAPIGRESIEWVVTIRFSIDGGKTWVMADGDGIANGVSPEMMRRVFITRPRVDYCKLGPDGNRAALNLFYRPTDTVLTKVVGQVYAAGITPGGGAGSGLVAQLGIGPADSDPSQPGVTGWTWVGATYKADIGNNDEWEADLPNPGTEGTWRVAMRFSISENAWRVCDVDGVNDSTTGELTFSPGKLGQLVVGNEAPKPPVTWCKIGEDQKNDPEVVNYQTTQTTGLKTVFANVNLPGVTDRVGAGPGLTGQLGWGPKDEDPRTSTSWNWSTQLTFNKDNFEVNDEFKAVLPNPAVNGEYRYAVRFSANGGPVRVCDHNGTDDGGQDFELDKLGTLNVTGEVVVPRVVGYCKLGPDGNTTPESVTYLASATGNRKVVGQVFVNGVTAGAGAGTGVVGQLGWGPAGENPTTSTQWNWTTAGAYKGEIGNNEEFEATLPNPGTVGSYRFAYRFQVNGGALLYCDADGNSGGPTGFEASKTGTLTVSDTPIQSVGYCKLGPDGNSTPESVTYLTTATGNRAVVGQVYVDGVTAGAGAGTGIEGELGWGPAAEDPTTSAQWNWSTAGTYKGEIGNNDEFEATLPNPGTPGSYRFAYRFRVNGGAFLYCDADGNDGGATGFEASRTGTLTVTPPQNVRVDYCKLGPDGNRTSLDLFYQPTDTVLTKVVGQVYSAGITQGSGAGAGVVAQLGIGPADSDPTEPGVTGWTWTAATYKGDLGNNDEWEADLPNPGIEGTYRVAMRFSVAQNVWRVCDVDGVDDSTTGPGTFSVSRLGVLTVGGEAPKPPVSWCKIGESATGPEVINYLNTQTTGLKTVFAQVNMPGVTDRVGAGPGLTGQLGWGPAGEDPRTSMAWNWTTELEWNKDNFEVNDEFKAVLPNPAVNGGYRYAVRFSANDGPIRVCDGNGTDDGGQAFELDQLGTLNVTNEVVIPRVVGYCKLGPDGNSTPESVTYLTTATANRAIVGQVYVDGVTAGAGAGTGVEGQLGWGPAGEDPTTSPQWNWSTNGTYKGEIGNNDEFEATLPNPGTAGGYRFAYRFQVNDGAFLYCDSDGNSGGAFDVARTGTLTVSEASSQTVGYCKLGPDGNDTPESVTYLTTAPASRNVVAQVYVEGVTAGAGAGTGVDGQLGWGPAAEDPTTSAQWNWSTAGTYKGEIGNNDEFEATLPNPGTPGSYRFAYRFRVSGGPFLYCDSDGNSGGAFDAARTGTLTVEAPAPVVGVCRLQSVDGTTVGSGDAVTAVGRVRIPGITNGNGPGANLQVQVGVGGATDDAATNPSAFTWASATYSREAVGEADTDEFTATVHPAYTGNRAVSLRYSTDGAAWTYCDKDGSDVGGYTVGQQHVLTVNNHTDIGWCALQSFTLTTTGGDRRVFGQAYEGGVTDSAGMGAGLVAHVGYGSAAQDPGVAGWTWIAAAYDQDIGNNDQFLVSLPDLPAGTSYVYRYSLNGGPYCFGDRENAGGSGNGFQASDLGTVTP
ncbi:IPT/TIG domain-containing protein [Pyxidicoccus sp. 3LG]